MTEFSNGYELHHFQATKNKKGMPAETDIPWVPKILKILFFYYFAKASALFI
jgi:hypothetical protein